MAESSPSSPKTHHTKKGIAMTSSPGMETRSKGFHGLPASFESKELRARKKLKVASLVVSPLVSDPKRKAHVASEVQRSPRLVVGASEVPVI